MKNIVRNLKLILFRKFEDLVTFEVCVGMFIVCLIIYCTYSFLLENEDFRGIILICSMPSLYSIPYDKYGWISEVYNVLRIVSGRIRFILYKSPIDFATSIDISKSRNNENTILKESICLYKYCKKCKMAWVVDFLAQNPYCCLCRIVLF